jgi:ribosomal protein S18 acetylase RimI-like enzyme
MTEIAIEALSAAPKIRAMLRDIVIETVANGGSVTFMHPLSPAMADAFWEESLASAARGERIVLGAWDGDILAGTVSLLLNCPPNQGHRADIAKLMTRVSHRRRGIAAALMREAEARAVGRKRTLLTLDTAAEDGASALYEKLGFTLAGTIPDYAQKPRGGLTGAMFYWKRIGEGAMNG